jgi:hypothetical protein
MKAVAERVFLFSKFFIVAGGLFRQNLNRQSKA